MTLQKATVSSHLETYLVDSLVDPKIFINDFLDWKSGDEDDSYYFAKDAFNLHSEHVRHVHMVPLFEQNSIEKWDANWRKFRKRTSDRYLFYVDGGHFGYLLLYIVNDPGAHTFLSDPSDAERELLREFERIADNFVHFGKTI